MTICDATRTADTLSVKLLNTGSFYETVAFWGVIIGLLTFIIEHRLSKKKFRHELTLKCIERYQDIVKNDVLTHDQVNIYLGFMNEELYYIQHGLVDRRMGKEWLSNMINYLPIFSRDDKSPIPVNQELLERTSSMFADPQCWDILFRYTRIRSAIYIEGTMADYTFTFADKLLDGFPNLKRNMAMRRKVACQMLLSLDSDCWYRRLYRRLAIKLLSVRCRNYEQECLFKNIDSQAK